MSDRRLIQLTPEQHMGRARNELRQQAMTLRLIADALEAPGISLADLNNLVDTEMPEVRTGLALARNFFKESLAQRARLQPELRLFQQRVEPIHEEDGV